MNIFEPNHFTEMHPLNRRTREKVLDYVKRIAEGLSLLILTSDPNCQRSRTERLGDTNWRDTEFNGLWLVAENWTDEENRTF